MTTSRPVFLAGLMGVGKTSVGEQLAKNLKCPFYDLDQLIEEKAGCSITEIFEKSGEDGFRALEEECFFKLVAGEGPFVLALGGGAITTSKILEHAKDHGKFIFLKMPLKKLAKRLFSERNHRPLIASAKSEGEVLERIEDQWSERKAFYESADYFVNVEGKSVKQIAKELAS